MLCEKFFFLVSIDSFFFWLYLYLSDQIAANYIELLNFSVAQSRLRKIWANFCIFFYVLFKQDSVKFSFDIFGIWSLR